MGFGEDYTSLNIMDWRYIITSEEIYQLTEKPSLENFQKQQ